MFENTWNEARKHLLGLRDPYREIGKRRAGVLDEILTEIENSAPEDVTHMKLGAFVGPDPTPERIEDVVAVTGMLCSMPSAVLTASAYFRENEDSNPVRLPYASLCALLDKTNQIPHPVSGVMITDAAKRSYLAYALTHEAMLEHLRAHHAAPLLILAPDAAACQKISVLGIGSLTERDPEQTDFIRHRIYTGLEEGRTLIATPQSVPGDLILPEGAKAVLLPGFDADHPLRSEAEAVITRTARPVRAPAPDL